MHPGLPGRDHTASSSLSASGVPPASGTACFWKHGGRHVEVFCFQDIKSLDIN
jgi:hypothetical protein